MLYLPYLTFCLGYRTMECSLLFCIGSFQNASNHCKNLLFLESSSNELKTNRQAMDFVGIVFMLLAGTFYS